MPRMSRIPEENNCSPTGTSHNSTSKSTLTNSMTAPKHEQIQLHSWGQFQAQMERMEAKMEEVLERQLDLIYHLKHQLQVMDVEIDSLLMQDNSHQGSPGESREAPLPTLHLPKPFKGDADQFDNFMIQCKRCYQVLSKMYHNDYLKVALITSLLEDDALTWAYRYLVNDDPILYDLTNFTTAFTKAFQDKNRGKRATRLLGELKLTGSIPDFNTKFRNLSHQTNWPDTVLQSHYYDAMPNNMKHRLTYLPRPMDIYDLMFQATEVWDGLQQCKGYRPPLSQDKPKHKLSTVTLRPWPAG